MSAKSRFVLGENVSDSSEKRMRYDIVGCASELRIIRSAPSRFTISGPRTETLSRFSSRMSLYIWPGAEVFVHMPICPFFASGGVRRKASTRGNRGLEAIIFYSSIVQE